MPLIVPSLLGADFARLGEALGAVQAAGASMVHVDVMDGHFVPRISVGQPVIQSLRRATDLALEVHLLVERPERYARQFVALGVERVFVHAEATPQLHHVLDEIRSHGALAGVALNPATPVATLSDVLEDLDSVLILAADPGVEGAPFLSRTLEKVREAAELRAQRRLDFAIEVEGAVGSEIFEDLIRAGADILVVGSAIFDKGDPTASLGEMIRTAAGVRHATKV